MMPPYDIRWQGNVLEHSGGWIRLLGALTRSRQLPCSLDAIIYAPDYYALRVFGVLCFTVFDHIIISCISLEDEESARTLGALMMMMSLGM